jgi:hypothetical protein
MSQHRRKCDRLCSRTFDFLNLIQPAVGFAFAFRCRCVWRAASASSTEIVSKILQRGAHALVIAEGRADPPRRPDRRLDLGRTNIGRTAPPICPGVSFQQGQGIMRRAICNSTQPQL